MTKETKLSLLVGLAFIITIGILLSDHFRSMNETPQADLTEAGPTARRAVEAPGTGNPPISIVAPSDLPPSQPVPTHEEMTRPVSPVVPATIYAPAQSNDSRTLIDNTNPQPEAAPQAQAPEDHGADLPTQERTLANLAERNGEPVVPSNIDGTPQASSNPSITAPASGPKQYKAQSGDTLSRMASRFLGSASPENVQAIIDANPSLQDDPDKVILGQTYVIPQRGQAAVDSSPNTAVSSPAPRNTNGEQYFYTVQEGDSLWQIANVELGDPSAVDALKELNASILKGKNHDVVTPGMKLRLPSKPLASAN